VNADWLGAPRLRTSRTSDIKTWRAFGAPSHFLCFKCFLESSKKGTCTKYSR